MNISLVALNYAVSREFSKTPENHIFYDMGAGSTVASIVSFSTAEVKEGKRTQNVPQLEVKAIGFDRTLGGHEFDVRLQSFLAEKFMENHGAAAGGDIRSSESAMSRLLKEANRVKQILSANTETMASVRICRLFPCRQSTELKQFRSKVFTTILTLRLRSLVQTWKDYVKISWSGYLVLSKRLWKPAEWKRYVANWRIKLFKGSNKKCRTTSNPWSWSAEVCVSLLSKRACHKLLERKSL